MLQAQQPQHNRSATKPPAKQPAVQHHQLEAGSETEQKRGRQWED